MHPIVRSKFKVKIRSLAAEAGIIRQEESKAGTDSHRGILTAHRTGIVRSEARHTQLAYAFLRDVPLTKVEKVGSKEFSAGAVERICKSLGGYTGGQKFKEGFETWAVGLVVERAAFSP